MGKGIVNSKTAQRLRGQKFDFTGLSDNDVLVYDLATNTWKPEAPAVGADGNGIYDGNGIIPSSTTSEVTDIYTFDNSGGSTMFRISSGGRAVINTATDHSFNGGDSHLTVRSNTSTLGRPIFSALNGGFAPAFTACAGGVIGINKNASASVQLDISCAVNVPMRITDDTHGAVLESYADNSKGGVIWQFGFSDTGTGSRPARGWFGVKGSDANGAAIEMRSGSVPTGSALIDGAIWRTGTEYTFRIGGNNINLFQGAALTAQSTQITQAGTFTPDFAIQAVTNSSPFGFVTADEAETFISVVENLQTRVSELEARLQASGQIA